MHIINIILLLSLIFRYTQLSKYAMTVVREVSTVRKLIGIAEKLQ